MTICTCDSPCCEVDIGIGYVTCGQQHCPVHATPENQGIPGGRTYKKGSLHGFDTVQGKRINNYRHLVNVEEDLHLIDDSDARWDREKEL
jgi:hypothetical protein